MLKPVNDHILIEPIAHETFIATQRDSYEEIGVVVALDPTIEYDDMTAPDVGDKVYFDSWLAAKYPKEGKDGEFYWLVKWGDIRAIEKVSE